MAWTGRQPSQAASRIARILSWSMESGCVGHSKRPARFAARLGAHRDNATVSMFTESGPFVGDLSTRCFPMADTPVPVRVAYFCKTRWGAHAEFVPG